MERRITIITKTCVCLVLAYWFHSPLLAQDAKPVNQIFSLNYDEHQPILGPEGRLYFTMAFHPQNNNGNNDPGDIWFSAGERDGFEAPEHLGQLSTPYYDLLIGFAHPDTMLVYHQNFQNQQVIYSYYRSGAAWERGEAVQIPGFKINGDQFSARLHADGKMMVMSMDSFGTYGNEDIYISFRKENGWSRPLNLGSDINSSLQELSPFLSADTRTLYFSTNASEGVKGMEVYFSKRMGEGWSQWSSPSPVNLPDMEGFDLYYYPDQSNDRAFYTNIQTSDGYGNILLLGSFISGPEDTPDVSAPTEADPEPNDTAEMDNNGASFPERPVSEKQTSFEELETGASMILDKLLFQRSTVVLADSSGLVQLEELAAYLMDHPKTVISVDGHTDNYGSSRLNERLSLDRAQKVRDILVENGVDVEQIRVNGWGGTRPIASNRTARGRAKNRRVEIKVLNKP
ncbi:OmpA family protein [Cyclobacterium plantarum]|uniref:OmpA family protein n=1 Tax=Cyclobacterium plantarum TaxID=2716263 RepID=UPI003F72C99C